MGDEDGARLLERWGVELPGPETLRPRSLLVTLPEVGDVQPGRRYLASRLAEPPLVTWCPAGSTADRFCLLAAGGGAHSGGPLRVWWLVVDIPGPTEEEEDSLLAAGPCAYGLAGNHWAVARGTAAVPYEAGVGVTELLVLLLKQTGDGPLAPQIGEVPRDCLSVDTLRSNWGLGEIEAAAVVDISAASAQEELGTAAEGPHRPPAYSGGGELVVDPAAPATLTAGLMRTAEVFPERGLTIYDASGRPGRLAYAELRGRAELAAGGLRAAAGTAGEGAALLQLPTIGEHVVAFWGCLFARIRPVAVAIPPSYEDAAHAVCGKIRNIWRLLEGPPVITAEQHAEKVGRLRVSAGMEALRLLTLEALLLAGAGNLLAEAASPADVAFYQLSSGSTGVPKCIQITHRGVVAHIHGESQFCGTGPDDVHVSFLPLDHVVPILTVHCCDVYHGCEEVQAEVSWVVAEPLRWLRLVSTHRGTRTWSPNFAFKLVADALRRGAAGDEAFELGQCRLWMNAGEQVTIPVCEDFLEQVARYGVPRKAMQPSFGMAEACTCMTYNEEFDIRPATRLGRSAFVNLGPPVPGIEIRIADDEHRTLPEETVGRFQIRGPVITPGYLRNEDANQASFIEDSWFNTGDIGFIKDGCLYLTGREKEMIIIRGANFYCYEIEDVVNALPSVTPTFTAATSSFDPSTGTEGLVVFFVPKDARLWRGDFEDAGDVLREVRGTLIRHTGLTPSQLVPLTLEEFPKTTSGKIQRGDLARALRAGRFDARLSRRT